MQTYHYDLRGSTIALTDAKGKVTDTYGEELSHDGTTNQPFQYDGRDGVQTDPNGLYQMRSRYYNPEIRRFVNRDVVTGTIADGLTMNRYAYVNGNPVSYVDPFGLSAEHSDLMRTGFSMALDAVPFVGTVKGIQEVLTGTDLITGQHLSVADRVAEGAGTLLSFLPDGKLLGTFAAKEAIDGGEWAWKQGGKEAVNDVRKSVGSAYDHVYTSTKPLDDLFPELKGVNPHYVEGAGPGVNTNCVSCANAATSRLIGDDPLAVASKSIGYGSRNDLLYSTPFGTVNNLSVEDVNKLMSEKEDSTIGIVIIDQGSIEHVINVVKKDESVYYIDTQMGKIVELNPTLKLSLGIR